MTIGIIPARYGSSRLPGKPLADICGKPMIWWPYMRAKTISELDEVYVATDDDRIIQVCKKYNMKAIMTSNKHKNGTERLSEVASLLKADYYVAIQGDEPLFDTRTVPLVLELVHKDGIDCALLKTPFKNPIDLINCTSAKVVTDLNDNAMYFSRSPMPYPKASLDYKIYDPIGVVAYTREMLLKYGTLEMGPLEKAEEIEFLRLLEHGYKIKVGTVDYECLEVNTPKDLERVRKYVQEHDSEQKFLKEAK